MISKEDYIRRLEERLKTWDERLDALKEKAAQSGEDMRQKFDEQRAHIATLREEAAQKLSELRTHSEGSWEALKDKTESAWEKMADQFEKLTSKFGHRG